MKAVPFVSLGLVLALVACATTSPHGKVLGGARRHFYRLDGRMYLDDKSGAVFFRLDEGSCKEERDVMLEDGSIVQREVPCAGGPANRWSTATLETPWGEKVPASAGGDRWFAFRIDWAATGIDPLVAGHAGKLNGAWKLVWEDADQPFSWKPTPHERIVMLGRIGEATDTEIDVQDAKAPPTLEVPIFETVEELRNGAASGLRLRVVNKGTGAAYRLVATTRSSLPALHGLQFSFGRIDPGEQKTRVVSLKLPRDNPETDAVVVLSFHEAHDFAPASLTKRFPIRQAADVATLTLSCRLGTAAVAGEREPVDAGQELHVVCDVGNDGSIARGVVLSAGITGGERRVTAEPFELRSGRTTPVRLSLEVPRNAQMDAELVIDVVAKDVPSNASARTELRAVVKKAKICPRGKLTRPQFDKRRADLKKTLEAGVISQAEYDRYEAELVGCLE